jgi:5-methyltetrahydrofolate--homocysteine methyltransferase
MLDTQTRSSQRERLLAVFRGEKPDRIPFIDRMDIWYTAKQRTGTMPERFRGLSLNQVHERVGMGRLQFASPYAQRLRGVEMVCTLDGEPLLSETDPVFPFFPGGWAPDFVHHDRAGLTRIEFRTPVGTSAIAYGLAEDMIPTAVDPYLEEHFIKDEGDIKVAEYILERIQFVPLFDEFHAEDAKLGDNGFLAPWTQRVPFQQLLLEYFGEVPLFYALADMPETVERLLRRIEEVFADTLEKLADLDAPYVEFPDNLDDMMTNPKLFQTYSLPAYQRYTEILHGQGKLVGSHTDGNLKRLLGPLKETGLDVCESVSPQPLTRTSFEEFWEAWGEGGPIMWGPVPSPLLEANRDEGELHAYLDTLLNIVGDGPLILGVSDMVVGENLIERVEYIAREVERFDPAAARATESVQPSPQAALPDVRPSEAEAPAAPRGGDGQEPALDHATELLDDLYDHTVDGKDGEIAALVAEALALGMEPREVLFEALVPALGEVGRLFEQGRYFVPDMLLSARAMNMGMETLRPVIAEAGGLNLGTVVMGTVRGDIHDIGKNLCCTMLEGAGFDVLDLGVNVAPEAFVAAIREHNPQVVGMSALLTTTAPMIGTTIKAIQDAGLRDGTKLLIGGAAVSPNTCAYYGADGYAPDAVAAVRTTKEVLGMAE